MDNGAMRFLGQATRLFFQEEGFIWIDTCATYTGLYMPVRREVYFPAVESR